ncbi:MAG: peptidyl-prolyl cis-trans isomerase [Gemmatimonadetes bacterium]|nr:peptidyl-prolyl cis-trans isomerase [Gemmatimonadota bacterium]
MKMSKGKQQAALRAGSLLLGLLVVLGACGKPEEEEIVAMVGQKAIHAEELRRFVLNLLPGLYTHKQGQEAREDYLQSLIDQELLLLEARNRGLEQDSQLVEKLSSKQRKYIVSVLRQREIMPLVEITEEDIRQRFEELGLARERFLTAIVVASQQEARELQQRLVAGESWTDLAQAHSLDGQSAERAGEVGFLNRSLAERMGIPVAVFDTLATGEVSPPLARGRAYQLIRFIGERQAELATHQAALQAQLMKIGQREVEDRKVEMLAYELDWAMDEAGRQVLAALAENPAQQVQHLSAADRSAALFSYKGGQVSVNEYLHTLKLHRVHSRKALADSAFITALARRFILPETMLAYAASQAGIPDEPAVVDWVEEAKEELLLTRLRQIEVSDKVAVEDEEARRYIEQHPEQFLLPERICYEELIVPTKEEAAQLAGELDEATDLLQVARQRGFNVRPRQPDGLVCMISLNEVVYPRLWPELQEAPLGALRGPVETRDGYIFFKVMQHQEPQPEPADKALLRARASLVQRQERERFNELMDQLRAKYRDQVTAFADRLDAALPDALLASLTQPPQKQIENP